MLAFRICSRSRPFLFSSFPSKVKVPSSSRPLTLTVTLTLTFGARMEVDNVNANGVVNMNTNANQRPPRKSSSSSESRVKTIGTHNGAFHADEVLACVMLTCLPEYKDAQIVRTRDDEILKTCDIVVDVGGIFDPETLRFDHHQNTFDHSMHSLLPDKPWTTKLSSAGLIYAHFGKDVIAHVLEKKKTDEMVEKLYGKIYANFVEEIDAIDNGIAVSDGPLKYRVTTNLSSRVGHFNSSWRDAEKSEDIDMTNFRKAMELVRCEFLQKLHFYATDWWEALQIVVSAVENRFEVHSGGYMIEFPNGGLPWKEHLRDVEDDMEVKIAGVIYQDKNGGMFRTQMVPISPDSFTCRVPLHKDWRGLRGKELQEISKIPTAQFVHSSGFIGGASDRGDAIKMIEKSVADVPDWQNK